VNPVFSDLKPTVFDVMSRLAAETGAINLGQGFPEEDGPLDIREAAARAVLEGPNQYPPMRGLEVLRRAVSAHYALHQGLSFDWKTGVTIVSGATEALAAAILAFTRQGDEVVLFEPMYDAYLPLVRRAGGVPVLARLAPPDWRLTDDILDRAFSGRTRLVILNTPGNPSGRVFTKEELERLASHLRRRDALAISDEVWEHVIFGGRQHVSMSQVAPERTLKIGSAGKMFQLTGWKVGFACGPENLVEPLTRAHQFLTFTTPPMLQTAVAYALARSPAQFERMQDELATGLDTLAQALRREGFSCLPVEGAYFLSVDLEQSGVAGDAVDFSMRCVREAGVAVIPYAPFYAAGAPPNLIRLCFAKSQKTLLDGVAALAKGRDLTLRAPTGFSSLHPIPSADHSGGVEAPPVGAGSERRS
jgi:aspartate/methionine/tyrosine aminotransferase